MPNVAALWLTGPVRVVQGYVRVLVEVLWRDRSVSKVFDGMVREEAFARFWLTISPPSGPSSSAPPAMPGPYAPLPGLLAQASGDVLEIGPGSGLSLQYFKADQIQTYTAVEPASRLHGALRTSASSANMGEKLRILDCGGEAESLLPMLVSRGGVLAQGGVSECFDTIVSVRSLCSIGKPESSIRAHYALLRPGGRYIVCEHVINPWPVGGGSFMGRVTQVVYTVLGWPYFVGGCKLSRDTVDMLRRAGKWESVELTRETDWAVLPFVTGIFVKER